MAQSALERARDLMRLGDLKGALETADAEIKRIGNQSGLAGIWDFRFIRARALEASGRAEEALSYLESLAPPLEEDVESGAAFKMYRASYSGFLGRYETSHRLFGEAENIARDSGLLHLLGDIHLSRAFIFFRQKDYVSSTALFRTALDLSCQVGGWVLRGHGLWGIGKNLMIQEHYQAALPWLNESLEVFEDADALTAVAMVWSELALCYLGVGNDEKAMELLRKAEKVNHDCGVTHNYQVVLANIGNVYLHRRDYFAAISYYRRALDLARQIKDPVSVKKWTYNINLAYARIRAAVDRTSRARLG